MAYRFSGDDVDYLTSAAGADAVAALDGLALTDSSLLADLTAARRLAGARAGAAVETVRLRRAAAAKFGPPSARWLFTAEALQQSTPPPVARHRAARLAQAGVAVHDVTCSIGTDTTAFAEAGSPLVVGSDLDPVRLAMAAHNHPELLLVRADALRPVTQGVLTYADPARRDGTGRRITGADTIPAIPALDEVHAARPPVLRAPPGIDYDALNRPGEVELVSLDGTVREAVLWPAEFAQPGVRRRATVLLGGPAAGAPVGARHWQLTDADPEIEPGGVPADRVGSLVGQWIVEPDPAVIRAHLVRQYAARHRLRQLDEHVAYLYGPAQPAVTRGFRVLDAAPYRERTVADWIRRDGIGTLEILQRGTPLVPDVLRRKLRGALSGDTTAAATLIVTRLGRRQVALWCESSPPG